MAPLFILGLLLTTIFLISRILISISSKIHEKKLNLPPGKTGWPLFGENPSFESNPEKFVQERMTKHSTNIFQTSLAGQRVAVLCGPTGNKFIFSNEGKTIRPWNSEIITKSLASKSTRTLFDLALFFQDQSFLKSESMQHFVAVMDSNIKDHVERFWVPYDVVKVHNLAKKIIFSLACKLFMNYNDEQVNDLSDPFFSIVQGLLSAPVNIPGTPYHAAMKGAAFVKKKLVAIVEQRKKELQTEGGKTRNDDHPDLLTRLLKIVDSDDRFFTQDEIASKVVGYLIASVVTTSNTIGYVLSHLAEYPHIYDKVLKEQLEITKYKEEGELLTWADTQQMKYSWNVVCESMRLMSPAPGSLKEVLTDDLTFSGFNIPKGWKVMWTPYSTNKDTKCFPKPGEFDPSRFEGNGPQPYTFVPFGGGPHMCPGKWYARINILVFMHNIVTRFKLKKVNPNEKIIYTPDPTPANGLPLHLLPHQE